MILLKKKKKLRPFLNDTDFQTKGLPSDLAEFEGFMSPPYTASKGDLKIILLQVILLQQCFSVHTTGLFYSHLVHTRELRKNTTVCL